LEPSKRSLAVAVAKEFVEKNWRSRYALRTIVFLLPILFSFLVFGIDWGSVDLAHGSFGRMRGGPMMAPLWMLPTFLGPSLLRALYVRRQVRRFATEMLLAESSAK